MAARKLMIMFSSLFYEEQINQRKRCSIDNVMIMALNQFALLKENLVS